MLELAILSLLPLLVAAQNTTAVCSVPNFDWSFNSHSQSPCAIASILGGACLNGKDISIKPLSPGLVYSGPLLQHDTSCTCSTVYYSVLSACAACQGGDFLPWSEYSRNCSKVYNQFFQQPIPSDTSVPHYAYLDVISANTFSTQAASAAAGPESTFVPTPTALPSTTATPGETDVGSAGGKKTNAGAIAGGVVGGVVALFLIIGVVFWHLRRKKRPNAPSSEYSYNPMMSNVTPGSITYPSTPAPKVYDPNDPSTFPSNMPAGPFTGLTTPSPDIIQQRAYISPNFTGHSGQSNYPQTSRPAYTGAPEL